MGVGIMDVTDGLQFGNIKDGLFIFLFIFYFFFL
jgi:hypothetical protein